MTQIKSNELFVEKGNNIYLDFGPSSFEDLVDEIRNLTEEFQMLSKDEMEFGFERYILCFPNLFCILTAFIKRVEIMLTTCEDRMKEEFEKFSFGHFIGLPYRSAVCLNLMQCCTFHPNNFKELFEILLEFISSGRICS
jgi:hypothetical protein